MAPQHGTKRQGAKVADVEPKKTKTDPNFMGVKGALNMAEDLSEETRQMFLAGLHQSLGTPIDKRHESQTKVVEMIGDVLEAVQEKLKAKAEAEEQIVADIENSKADLDDRLARATSARELADEAVSREEQALQQATEAAVSAKDTLRTQQKADTAAESARKKAEKHADIFTIALENYKAMSQGEDEDGKARFTKLQPVIKELGLEDSLQLALPSACAKKVTDRSGFDTMVIQQLGVQLQEKLDLGQQAFKEAQDKVAECSAAVEAAKAEIERTTQERQGVADELAKATATQRDANTEEKAAQEAKETFDQRLEDAIKIREEKKDALENFKIYNIGCYQMLRDAESEKVEEKDIGEAVEMETGETVAVGGA